MDNNDYAKIQIIKKVIRAHRVGPPEYELLVFIVAVLESGITLTERDLAEFDEFWRVRLRELEERADIKTKVTESGDSEISLTQPQLIKAKRHLARQDERRSPAGIH